MTNFVGLVEDRKRALVLRFGRVLKIINVLANDLAVRYEVALPVDHVRYHHDLVDLLVRELERRLGRLNIKRHDHRLGSLDALGDRRDRDDALQGSDGVPEPDADV